MSKRRSAWETAPCVFLILAPVLACAVEAGMPILAGLGVLAAFVAFYERIGKGVRP